MALALGMADTERKRGFFVNVLFVCMSVYIHIYIHVGMADTKVREE